MEKKSSNIGHNHLKNNGSNIQDLKTTKKGFYVNYDKAGYRIDHYNTNTFRRLVRKGLIKLVYLSQLKTSKKDCL